VSRFWILAGAFAATAATLALALSLGSWGFEYRRYSLHEGRLRRVLQQEPTMPRLTEGLAEEGASVLAAPASPVETEQAIEAHGGARAAEIREKVKRWGHLRIYRAADMLYFVFYDDDQVMRDFTCVGS
jgi:hypothetical protein